MSITFIKRDDISKEIIDHIRLTFSSPVINLKKNFARTPNTKMHKYIPLVGDTKGYYIIASENNYSDVTNIVAIYYIE